MATEDATKDLEKGKDCFDNFQKSDKFSSMLKSYVSVVSPDRIGIIKGTLRRVWLYSNKNGTRCNS